MARNAKSVVESCDEDVLYVMMVAVVIGAVLVGLTGCVPAGEIYLGSRRIDEFERTERMVDKPLKCLFTDCPEYMTRRGDK